ncbi:type II secretion system protein [Pseudomonas sp.]|uniref:type II secretion system protein n=1 Tax=Pseudomonas sp. TaxID=306 RepID=UPI001A0F82B6|nr:type II secretion system protein [Pseudomonas sp.]MBF0674043.1 type II secretion system protein [Pseudomonas sp.]
MNTVRQRGFTLLELLVVVGIVAILAAVALPRFMDANTDAHSAGVKNTAGALAAGVALARSQWELNRAKGVLNAQQNVSGFGEHNLDVNAHGWPIATDSGSGAQGCAEVWSGVLLGSAPTVAVHGTADYLAEFATPLCLYHYRLDSSTKRSIRYNADTGAVITVAE